MFRYNHQLNDTKNISDVVISTVKRRVLYTESNSIESYSRKIKQNKTKVRSTGSFSLVDWRKDSECPTRVYFRLVS